MRAEQTRGEREHRGCGLRGQISFDRAHGIAPGQGFGPVLQALQRRHIDLVRVEHSDLEGREVLQSVRRASEKGELRAGPGRGQRDG